MTRITAVILRARTTARVLALVFSLVPIPARAEDPPPPFTSEAGGTGSRAAAVEAYGDADPSCREWRNGCIVCRRTDGGAVACSTPGIACLPEAVACTARE